MKIDNCQICGITCKCTKHHLIPVVKCHNKYKQIKEDPSNHIWICRSCHDQIHALFSENELRDTYNTIEKLLENPQFLKFVEWKKKHPNFNSSSKMSNARKNRL